MYNNKYDNVFKKIVEVINNKYKLPNDVVKIERVNDNKYYNIIVPIKQNPDKEMCCKMKDESGEPIKIIIEQNKDKDGVFDCLYIKGGEKVLFECKMNDKDLLNKIETSFKDLLNKIEGKENLFEEYKRLKAMKEQSEVVKKEILNILGNSKEYEISECMYNEYSINYKGLSTGLKFKIKGNTVTFMKDGKTNINIPINKLSSNEKIKGMLGDSYKKDIENRVKEVKNKILRKMEQELEVDKFTLGTKEGSDNIYIKDKEELKVITRSDDSASSNIIERKPITIKIANDSMGEFVTVDLGEGEEGRQFIYLDVDEIEKPEFHGRIIRDDDIKKAILDNNKSLAYLPEIKKHISDLMRCDSKCVEVFNEENSKNNKCAVKYRGEPIGLNIKIDEGYFIFTNSLKPKEEFKIEINEGFRDNLDRVLKDAIYTENDVEINDIIKKECYGFRKPFSSEYKKSKHFEYLKQKIDNNIDFRLRCKILRQMEKELGLEEDTLCIDKIFNTIQMKNIGKDMKFMYDTLPIEIKIKNNQATIIFNSYEKGEDQIIKIDNVNDISDDNSIFGNNEKGKEIKKQLLEYNVNLLRHHFKAKDKKIEKLCEKVGLKEGDISKNKLELRIIDNSNSFYVYYNGKPICRKIQNLPIRVSFDEGGIHCNEFKQIKSAVINIEKENIKKNILKVLEESKNKFESNLHSIGAYRNWKVLKDVLHNINNDLEISYDDSTIPTYKIKYKVKLNGEIKEFEIGTINKSNINDNYLFASNIILCHSLEKAFDKINEILPSYKQYISKLDSNSVTAESTNTGINMYYNNSKGEIKDLSMFTYSKVLKDPKTYIVSLERKLARLVQGKEYGQILNEVETRQDEEKLSEEREQIDNIIKGGNNNYDNIPPMNMRRNRVILKNINYDGNNNRRTNMKNRRRLEPIIKNKRIQDSTNRQPWSWENYYNNRRSTDNNKQSIGGQGNYFYNK